MQLFISKTKKKLKLEEKVLLLAELKLRKSLNEHINGIVLQNDNYTYK